MILPSESELMVHTSQFAKQLAKWYQNCKVLTLRTLKATKWIWELDEVKLWSCKIFACGTETFAVSEIIANWISYVNSNPALGFTNGNTIAITIRLVGVSFTFSWTSMKLEIINFMAILSKL